MEDQTKKKNTADFQQFVAVISYTYKKLFYFLLGIFLFGSMLLAYSIITYVHDRKIIEQESLKEIPNHIREIEHKKCMITLYRKSAVDWIKNDCNISKIKPEILNALWGDTSLIAKDFFSKENKLFYYGLICVLSFLILISIKTIVKKEYTKRLKKKKHRLAKTA